MNGLKSPTKRRNTQLNQKSFGPSVSQVDFKDANDEDEEYLYLTEDFTTNHESYVPPRFISEPNLLT